MDSGDTFLHTLEFLNSKMQKITIKSVLTRLLV